MLNKAAVCLAVILTASACATRGPVRSTELRTPPPEKHSVPQDSLETFMSKVRERSARATAPNGSVRTVEASDPVLAAALLAATTLPSAATHRAVAEHYVRLGILDEAQEHFTAALAIDPRDAAAWDGMARIWRRWGFPNRGLIDAYRAIHFAPTSPVARNTLGTLFQALGRRAEARTQYEMALKLEPTAAYAWSNLCYGLVLDGQPGKAAEACRTALKLQPDLDAALNNLALAYGASGDVAAAEYMFSLTGRQGRAQYNVGIVQMARRRYPEAVKAFEEAQALRPQFRAAAVMARLARDHATNRSEP